MTPNQATRGLVRVKSLMDQELKIADDTKVTARKGELLSLPKAAAYQLVGQKKAVLAPDSVRFLRSYGQYNPGERAGFAPAEAKRLVQMKVAVYDAVYQEELEEYEPKVNDDVDISKLNWQEAVNAVRACNDLDLLARWQGIDTRKSVSDAIIARLGELA